MNRRGFLGTLIAAALGRKVLPKVVTRIAKHTAEPTGMTIRMIRTYNRDTDRYEVRMDCLYGFKTARPELCCRVAA